MDKKWSAIILALVFVVGLATGCAKQAGARQEQPEAQSGANREIHIAYQAGSAIILIGKGKGWYEEEFKKDGTQVKYNLFLSGPPLIEAFAGGREDVGNVGDMPPVSGRAAGVDLKVIANAGYVPFSNALFVRPDSPYQSVSDLRGKKIAVQIGSSAHHFLILLLKKYNLQPTDVNIVNLAAPDQLAALESGNIDAAATWEPWGATLENAGAGKTLIDSVGIKRNVSSFIVRNDFAQKNPGLIERFLKVNQRVIEFIKTNPDEALAILAKESKLPEAALAKSFKQTVWTLALTQEDVDGLSQVKDFLKESKVIKKDFDVNELIDRRYLKNIGVQ